MATASAELETKSLPANAYQPLKEGEVYLPLVPTDMSLPEVTWRAVIWGTLLQRRVPTEMLGRVSSLDFFVSLAFMPVSFAIVGPLSKVVSMQTIFLVAGIAPVLLAAVAMYAARMRQDELAHPLR